MDSKLRDKCQENESRASIVQEFPPLLVLLLLWKQGPRRRSPIMWSTTMARNFPSPMSCGGGPMICIPRRTRSATRGLLVPPLSPLSYPYRGPKGSAKKEETYPTKSITSTPEPKNGGKKPTTELPRRLQANSRPQESTTSPLAVDTTRLDTSDPAVIEILSCDSKDPVTPRSSFRRGHPEIPSPPPTPETVSCGSSCASFTSQSTPKSSDNDTRHVQFDQVYIREHPRILGDNPSVKRGPAVSLGWFDDNGREMHYSVDSYEAIREPQRRKNICLSSSTRKKMLLQEAGVTLKDIQRARMETTRIKQSRRQHNVFVEYDDTIVVMESCVRTVQGLLTGRLSDWELERLMRQAKQAEKLQAEKQ